MTTNFYIGQWVKRQGLDDRWCIMQVHDKTLRLRRGKMTTTVERSSCTVESEYSPAADELPSPTPYDEQKTRAERAEKRAEEAEARLVELQLAAAKAQTERDEYKKQLDMLQTKVKEQVSGNGYKPLRFVEIDLARPEKNTEYSMFKAQDYTVVHQQFVYEDGKPLFRAAFEYTALRKPDPQPAAKSDEPQEAEWRPLEKSESRGRIVQTDVKFDDVIKNPDGFTAEDIIEIADLEIEQAVQKAAAERKSEKKVRLVEGGSEEK